MPEPFAIILAAAIGWNGLLNLYGPSFVLRSFDEWGFPHHFNLFVGLWELAAAALIVFPPTRDAGAALAAICLFGALVMIARDRTWLKLEYPLVLFALSVSTLVA